MPRADAIAAGKFPPAPKIDFTKTTPTTLASA
jgi:hypothetical protein